MIIRYCKDDGTLIKEIQIDTEEEKALKVVMADIVEWHQNFLRHRARQEIDRIVEMALRSSNILSNEDKKLLRQHLDEEGIVIASVRDLPMEVKKKIVRKIKME